MIDLHSAVFAILNEAKSTGAPIPSLRAIRLKTQTGSMTTIANIVREWRAANVPEEPKALTGFDANQALALQTSVWKLVEPIIRDRTEALRQHFLEKVAILEDKVAALEEENGHLLEEKDDLLNERDDEKATARRYFAERIKFEAEVLRLREQLQEFKQVKEENIEIKAQLLACRQMYEEQKERLSQLLKDSK